MAKVCRDLAPDKALDAAGTVDSVMTGGIQLEDL
jgi:hypothetical protein